MASVRARLPVRLIPAPWRPRAETSLRAPADPTPAHRRAFAPDASRSPFEGDLRRLVGRLRVQDAVVVAPPTLARAALVSVGAVAFARLADLGALGALVAIAACTWGAAVLVRAMVRRIGPFEAARRADHHLGLRAQLTTAMELIDAGAEGELVALQVSGATVAARAIIPATALPAFPGDPNWRRDASKRTGTALAALAAAIAILAWPEPPAGALPVDEPTLVLADARAPGDAPALAADPTLAEAAGTGDAIDARGTRAGEVGAQAGGLLGDRQDGEGAGTPPSGQAPGEAPRAGQDASQPLSATARAEALQKLGDALRQAQASRAAGESLRRGDAPRAAEQLNQLADQLAKLGPSEREALAQAFGQAAKDTQASDRQVSDAARQAAQALAQFRDNDARDAIRREANAVRQAGEASNAQRDRDARASDLARGAQPSLPQGDQQAAGQSRASGMTPEQAALGDTSGEPQPGGPGQATPGGAEEGGLGSLEQQLRGGSADGAPDGGAGGQGAGAGRGAGSTAPGGATRLEAQAVPVSVQAEQGDGPSTWRPPRPDTPAVAPPPAPATAGGPASGAPIGGGADINAIPREHADAVRRYFTPDASPGEPAPRPVPARGLVDGTP